MSARRLRALTWAGLAVVVACATVNLTRWPVPWFDEGIHLHVPEAVVRYGAYADFSSDGLRHFGPTLAVGPTVMLPIAGVFELSGVGLLQGRLVMAAYFVAFIAAFYLLGRRLGGRVTGLATAALLLSSPGPSTIEYGRQVLGEVPGGLFLAAGLLTWFGAWSARPSLARLAAAGVLLGLATATKHVYLLALAPALLAAFGLNLVYYRTLPQLVFLVPGAICAAIFGLWQFAVLAWLSPGSLAENWALLRQTSDGAAFVFNPATSRQSLLELMGVNGYFGLLAPAVAYSAWRARRKTLHDQMWGTVALIAMANLGWYVLASLGWMRYAFVGLILGALLVARLWRDLLRAVRQAHAEGRPRAASLGVALGLWLAAVVALPLASTSAKLVRVPPADAPGVADWLRANVPETTVVETWEPELAVFTDHRYHYPPPALLIHAVAHIARGGPSPATRYAFRDGGAPDYVVVGAFARWVGLYADADLAADYERAHVEGPYVVWKRASRADTRE